MEHSHNLNDLPITPSAILPIWQPYGYSTHEISRLIGLYYGLKTSHTGTLDPMASGVVIILLGEERLKKYEYAKWPKTYEFEIMFGISTDTFDGLGLITNSAIASNKSSAPDLDTLKTICSTFVGDYQQTVPIYSAIKVNGKSLHKHARSQLSTKLPMRAGSIFSFEVLSLEVLPLKNILETIIPKIKLVQGDFRQDQILDQWEKYTNLGYQVSKARFQVQMSKGLYVRSLSQDLCLKLNTIGFVSDIVRVANGAYIK